MSRRKRHVAKPQTEQAIEWLKHRTGYPSAEEREQIIRLRMKIAAEVIMLRLTNKTDEHGLGKLVEKYGKEEIERALHLGADDYVTKPFYVRDLQRRIERILEQMK